MAESLPKTAFLLNILCDEEFTYRTAYHPSASVMAQLANMQRLAENILLPGDLRFEELTAHSEPIRLEAWCPTNDAVKQWKAKKFFVPNVPPMDVLKLVNHRAFAASILQPLPGACFVSSKTDVLSVIRTPSVSGQWLLKRPFSYAGKGQLRVCSSEALAPRQENWIATSIERYHGLQVEPFVHRIADYSLHGFLFPDGTFEEGSLVLQEVDSNGAWRQSTLNNDELIAFSLHQTLISVIERLHQVGYFGPLGLDAFRWLDSKGTSHFNPLCEINARYSMGWPTGMHAKRTLVRKRQIAFAI